MIYWRISAGVTRSTTLVTQPLMENKSVTSLRLYQFDIYVAIALVVLHQYMNMIWRIINYSLCQLCTLGGFNWHQPHVSREATCFPIFACNTLLQNVTLKRSCNDNVIMPTLSNLAMRIPWECDINWCLNIISSFSENTSRQSYTYSEVFSWIHSK